MNLSSDQVAAVRLGEAVPFTDPELGVDCILVRADVFQSLAYDDRPLTDNERDYLLRQFGQRAGWDDPALDVYEEFREQS